MKVSHKKTKILVEETHQDYVFPGVLENYISPKLVAPQIVLHYQHFPPCRRVTTWASLCSLSSQHCFYHSPRSPGSLSHWSFSSKCIFECGDPMHGYRGLDERSLELQMEGMDQSSRNCESLNLWLDSRRMKQRTFTSVSSMSTFMSSPPFVCSCLPSALEIEFEKSTWPKKHLNE